MISDVIQFNSLSEIEQELVLTAWEASKFAYAPYSNFPVGAALLASNKNGETRIFRGCNVENANFTTICAEKTTIVKAVSDGFQDLLTIAVVCAKVPGGFPCGDCRQILREFSTAIPILTVVSAQNECVRRSLDELFPESFGPSSLSWSKPLLK
jgi:cytidine deaminase